MNASGTANPSADPVHSRWFWLLLAIGLALIGFGVCWLLLGRSPSVGATLIAAGSLAAGRLFIDRWRLGHGYAPFSDWRPSRALYIVPAVLFGIGLLLILLVPGHTSPWIRLGIVLVSVSITGAGVLAIRRAMLNTEPD